MVVMTPISDSWYREHLVCPDCRSELTIVPKKITCSACNYAHQIAGHPELKPIKPPPLTVALPRIVSPHPVDVLEKTNILPPKLTYDGPVAKRDSRELMSEIKRLLKTSGRVLDLGCGPRDQIKPITHLGHQYVGIDYSNSLSDFLADAHALPFADNTFDCVLSYAVLEHLHNPFIAATEVERVLKPGGVYIGTVSQGEPFHDSYFHHTPWGLLSLVSSVTDLEILRLWSSDDTLGSLSRMGRYPKIVKLLLKIVDNIHVKIPLLAPRKMKWPERDKVLDHLYRAGSLCFVAQKPNTKSDN